MGHHTSTLLVPVSSGGPPFRGDTVPSTGGAVVVDFSDMKKIPHVDATNWVAMVEAVCFRTPQSDASVL